MNKVADISGLIFDLGDLGEFKACSYVVDNENEHVTFTGEFIDLDSNGSPHEAHPHSTLEVNFQLEPGEVLSEEIIFDQYFWLDCKLTHKGH